MPLDAERLSALRLASAFAHLSHVPFRTSACWLCKGRRRYRHAVLQPRMLRAVLQSPPARCTLLVWRPRRFEGARAILRRVVAATAAPNHHERTQAAHDEERMQQALQLAREAAAAGEVPVGALLEHEGRVLALAHNECEARHDPTAHAEMLCLRAGASALRGWRELPGATLYVTLEPCAMCAGALLQARVGTLVWGAPNKLLGADGSWVSLLGGGEERDRTNMQGDSTVCSQPVVASPVRPHAFHPRLAVRRGVLAEPCSELMRDFFRLRREAGGADDADEDVVL